MSKFTSYIKDSYNELTQKVTWPSWSKLQSSALLVMIVTVIFAVIIFLMDFAFRNILEGIYSL
ncbi:MAG: preprotein translocase subunit SecE [Bacteroidales bacterium]|nr:preprotein translocase subunit SecE [Bacteroidales bacterium]